ncbi:MAG: DUF1929 domain-containing protein [Candidatus Eisenbacteria bacterium]|uniref:DUF1929 domain-containing protein n=1 Tax=Eiseniibacteriota bacterium TaxID=2212470 RepID=A0A849SL73_UNCEI|nr:DUF1929 domain-containing protein [Candidatus Eisenbacteria bacterium]
MKWDTDDNRYEWSQITNATGTPPSARYGHASFYDPIYKRILIWGGTNDGANPIGDNGTVYVLDISNPSVPAWSTITPSGTPPAARFGTRMMLDPYARWKTSNTAQYRNFRGVMFGGRTGAGNSGLKNDLWSLWISNTGTALEWTQDSYATTQPEGSPAPRAYHVMTLDAAGRLSVFGGDVGVDETPSPLSDRRAWSAAMPASGGGGDAVVGFEYTWDELETNADVGVVGAAAAHWSRTMTSHIPDVFAIAGSSATRTTHSTSALKQSTYPFNFLLPDGKLFAAGPENQSFRLSAPGQTWESYPGYGDIGLPFAASAAMYAPGKILTSGSQFKSDGGLAHDEARMIDLTVSSPSWKPTVNTMYHHRFNHNLVVAPNGHVWAIGGTQVPFENDPASKQPEYWNPDITGSGSQGQWYNSINSEAFPEQALIRGYHSTAILLPDGRILSAGGNNDEPPSPGTGGQYKSEIYCPPYLFRSNGTLAKRPAISTAPTTLTPGKTFTLCCDDPGSVTRVCLIAPGAVTHGFDQNQRYVPLEFKVESSSSRLIVKTPPSLNYVPPGDYLLFIVGSNDGGTAFPNMPSIAKWVRVQSAQHVDACDALAPATTTNLTVEVTAPTAIFMSATAPGDDGSLRVSGLVSGSELRRHSVSISSSNWSAATTSGFTAAATFDSAGSEAYFDATGLSSNTTYHFAFKSKDDAAGPNWSGVSNSASATTSGGGGGGYLVAGSDRPTTASITPSEAGLIAEATPTAGSGWTVTLSRVADVEGFAASDAGLVVLQDDDASEGWRTRRKFAAPADLLGLCALRVGRRTLVLGDFELSQVASRIKTESGHLALTSAAHSQLGSLAISAPEPVAISLEIGEQLVLTYTTTTASEGAMSEFAVVARGAELEGMSGPRLHRPALSLPTRFALHQNTPNPFAGSTAIRFDLPRASQVRLEVFDLFGRRVRTLVQGERAAGSHQVEWDRISDSGHRLSAGVYVARLVTEGYRAESKMVIAPK